MRVVSEVVSLHCNAIVDGKPTGKIIQATMDDIIHCKRCGSVSCTREEVLREVSTEGRFHCDTLYEKLAGKVKPEQPAKTPREELLEKQLDLVLTAIDKNFPHSPCPIHAGLANVHSSCVFPYESAKHSDCWREALETMEGGDPNAPTAPRSPDRPVDRQRIP